MSKNNHNNIEKKGMLNSIKCQNCLLRKTIIKVMNKFQTVKFVEETLADCYSEIRRKSTDMKKYLEVEEGKNESSHISAKSLRSLQLKGLTLVSK